MIKKFFRDSGPQFTNLKDFWIEEFCRRLKSVVVKPGKVLKPGNSDTEKLYILIKGKVSVSGPEFDSINMILLNEYFPGQSFCDPVLNETASFCSEVSVTSNS